jgi:hypothetical protein
LEPTSNYEEGEPPGLPKEVYIRTYHLKQQIADESLPEVGKINARVLLEAYRKGELTIKPGLVSCWVDGVRITDFMPYDLNRISQIQDEHASDGQAF